MHRLTTGGALAAALLASSCATTGQETAATAYDCTRPGLQAAVDAYLAAQAAGDPSLMSLAENAVYKEQFAAADVSTGIIQTPLAIDYTNTLLDEQQCETFTEIVVTDPSHPYMLGVHLTVADGAIAEVDTIVTDDDDWMFSAQRFLDGVKDEDWGIIPEAQRDSRETIIAAAEPYFPMFVDVSIQPPWAETCARQEGAMRLEPCALTQPLNVEFGERDYVVDTAKGSAAALVLFGLNLPDSHTFRIEDGKVRYIHTITNCMGEFNCGFGLLPYMVEERQARGGDLGPATETEG